MRISLNALLPLLVLVGCAVQPAKTPTKNVHAELFRLHDGVWLGPIAVTGVAADDSDKQKNGSPMKATFTFMVTVCDGKGIFLTKREDGSFHSVAREDGFGSRSNFGNHLIYVENHDRDTQPAPDWSETQTLLLVELESGILRAQWSRAVSNPTLPETAHDRDFFWHGVGTLKRVATECPREMMQTKVYD